MPRINEIKVIIESILFTLLILDIMRYTCYKIKSMNNSLIVFTLNGTVRTARKTFINLFHFLLIEIFARLTLEAFQSCIALDDVVSYELLPRLNARENSASGHFLNLTRAHAISESQFASGQVPLLITFISSCNVANHNF